MGDGLADHWMDSFTGVSSYERPFRLVNASGEHLERVAGHPETSLILHSLLLTIVKPCSMVQVKKTLNKALGKLTAEMARPHRTARFCVRNSRNPAAATAVWN